MLDTKPSRIRVAPREGMVIEPPGAGGYGKPAERDKEAVEQDPRSGKFSEAHLEREYPRGNA